MVALANVLVMVPPFGARTRWLAFALSMAVVLVPQGLESLGLISPTFDVTDDGVTITSRMAGMPPVWFLVVHFLMVSAATTLGTFQLANRARAVDLSARSHAWLLRRVLSTS